jgi:hypothetical protein
MPNPRSAFTEIPGPAEPEAREERIQDLEFDVMLERRFYKPLLRVVGGLVVAETAMTAHDAIMQHQGLTPENAFGIVGAVAGTLAVRGLSRMIKRRTEASALELKLLTSEPAPATGMTQEIGAEPATEELVAAA